MQAHYQSTMRDEADSSYMAGFGDMNLQRARQARNMDDPRDEAAILRAHTAAATESRKRVKAEKKSVVPVKYTAVKPAPQPKAKAPVDDIERKTSLLRKVTGYKKLRPDIKPRGSKTVTIASSTVELEDEVAHIQNELGKDVNSSSQLPMTLLGWGMQGIELATQAICPKTIDVRGLGAAVQLQKAELGPLMNEIMIKYGASMSMSVEMRLLMALSYSATYCHMQNTGHPQAIHMMEAFIQAQELVVPGDVVGAKDL